MEPFNRAVLFFELSQPALDLLIGQGDGLPVRKIKNNGLRMERVLFYVQDVGFLINRGDFSHWPSLLLAAED